MKKILVTGGAGFIGSNLCRELLKYDDNFVICMDNLYTGSKSNIQDLLENPRFEFILHDVTLPYDFAVDQIYNLACPASPPFYQKNPIATFETSILGITNALKLAMKYKATILQASTSEVYGDALVHPQSETYWGNVNPNGIRSCYDEGKRGAETLMMDYHRMYNVDTRIVRIFNTYGVGMNMDDGRVVTNFINQALHNKDITIYGDGNQTRSFCYVSDTVRGLISLMNARELRGADDICLPVNIGNPGEFTMNELADLIVNKLLAGKTSSTIVYKPLPKDDPKQRKPDITRAKELLGWEPKISLEDGLKEMINTITTPRLIYL